MIKREYIVQTEEYDVYEDFEAEVIVLHEKGSEFYDTARGVNGKIGCLLTYPTLFVYKDRLYKRKECIAAMIEAARSRK